MLDTPLSPFALLSLYCEARGAKPKTSRGQRALAKRMNWPVATVGNAVLVDVAAADEIIRQRALDQLSSPQRTPPATRGELTDTTSTGHNGGPPLADGSSRAGRPPGIAAQRLTDDDIALALHATCGNQNIAARLLGQQLGVLVSRQLVHTRIRRSTALQRALVEAKAGAAVPGASSAASPLLSISPPRSPDASPASKSISTFCHRVRPFRTR